MHAKRVLFFLLLFAFTFKAYPAIFVVTNNSDSGPGTLRDALTQTAANGSAVKDYINFNLPDLSAAGRTINLISQLPDVSSNVIIDGTTQPGSTFGPSDAKVKITNTFVYLTNLNIFYSYGGDQIEIYGLCLLGDMTGWGGSAFHFRNFGTITIGAPNKGNFIEWGNIGIDTGKTCYFQNNVCWTDETGEVCKGGNVTVVTCDKLILGGSSNAGNVFAGTINLVYSQTTTSLLEMSYNKIGTNSSGTQSPEGFYVEAERVYILVQYPESGAQINVPVNAVIKNNIIADTYDTDLLNISDVSGNIVIQGNAFNTDIAGQLNLNTYSHSIASFGIAISCSADVLIGGNLPEQRNVIAYCEDAIGDDSQGKFSVTQNSIFCYGEKPIYPFRPNLPNVQIKSVTPNLVSGTATPNAIIELFNADCSCSLPGPRYYFATVKADNAGLWKYIGSINGYIMASPTLDNLTGSFTGLNIDDSNVLITNSTCTGKGSITGIKTQFTSGFKWYNSQNQLVGTSLDLTSVPPGNYTLKIDFGTTCELTRTYTVQDYSIIVDVSKIQYAEPSCSQLGSITGINVSTQSDSYFYQWIDQTGNVECNCIDLYNAPAGAYTFQVGSTDGTCKQSFGPFTLKNTTGPNIDQSKVAIQPTNCGQSTGSITNLVITGTGTLKYSWLNDQQQQVATSANLTNQPAGTYKLQVTDDTQCGPIFSSDFEIPELNGITLDESNVKIVIASCSINNGSVTGIKIDGATQYQWLDANNKVVATTPDLQNAAAGDYTLTASNSFGCTETSKPYHIGQQLPTQFPVYTDVIISSCLGDNNGSVSVTTDALVKSLRWQNSQGQTISTDADLTGVPTGVYQLYFTDQNGCESLYQSFTVPELARFTVAQAGLVTNDQCGLKTGSVTATTVSGGLPPYAYKWVDAGGVQVGSGSAITNLTNGSYTLNIIDSKCGNIDIDYTINEQTEDITAPTVNNAQLCSSGTVVLTVNKPVTSSTYRLYDSQTSTQPLDEQAGGSFTVNVTNSRSYFISQLTGTCESSRSEVKVTVGISALNIINTFTPNGDGINDYWKITGIENYPDATVRVFNRYGQKEFDSKGYAVPFDGRYGGKILPPGVYYYIINLSNNCNMLSGSLTIIR